MGASSCNQCHGATTGAANGAYSPSTSNVAEHEGKTNFMPDAYVHTSAVADLNGQCIDGGFSFPHRTLGANMLKDELYGVDFDGSAVAPGDDRTAGAGLDLNNYSPAWYQSSESETRPIRRIG